MLLKAKIKVLVFVIWAFGASVFIALIGYDIQRQFDPHLILSSAIMDLSFEENFTKATSLSFQNNAKGHLVHIGTKANCACEFIAQSHQSSLDSFAVEHNLSSRYIKIEDFPELAQFVPSLPAVAFFDSEGVLKFYGPYSTGAGCFGSFGFIDSFLQSYIDNTAPSEALIISEALGCYCENNADTF